MVACMIGLFYLSTCLSFIPFYLINSLLSPKTIKSGKHPFFLKLIKDECKPCTHTHTAHLVENVALNYSKLSVNEEM
jgi:hypothetical protein